MCLISCVFVQPKRLRTTREVSPDCVFHFVLLFFVSFPVSNCSVQLPELILLHADIEQLNLQIDSEKKKHGISRCSVCFGCVFVFSLFNTLLVCHACPASVLVVWAVSHCVAL